METVIILLYAFLSIIGATSIITAIIDLCKYKKIESDSSVEIKSFKWKAPVRLVFGLLCILIVIVINKWNFFQVDKAKLKELENKVEELTYENNILKNKMTDSIQSNYFLIIENETGKSIMQGKVLISNYYLHDN